MMRPYEGANFRNQSKPSLLLVGESHYLPDGSSQHLDPDRWYKGSSKTLNETERGWISTPELIQEAREESFANRAHGIWKNAFLEINEYGPKYEDYTRVADDVAFCNFFLRPAIQGESLVVSSMDVDVANDVLLTICDQLRPTAVIFVSTLARNNFRHAQTLSIPIIGTPHPSCRWWNRAAQKYGNKRGRDILGEFVRSLEWRRTSKN